MTADDFDSAAALSEVKEAIAKAESDAARPEGAVTLVAVSKVHGADRIVPVLQAGHRVFGENRVQEAQGKWPALKERFPDVELHLIGPLQSNKAGDAVALFDVIESVDREKIAKVLAAEMDKQGRRVPVLVQINTGKEPQKAGIDPEDADAFIARCRDEFGLEVRGVMCIPPVDEEPALHFALLREIARRNGLPVLSMGMSDDYPTAIALGATHVRVGTAVFGHRPTKG
ncbi:YggS family pyridoxal phosphate-dependent enzyme [Caenispirillum salinarum]|uniref:YggS family pyridoxal phosphate-dependent enzyme n=1 Tax=Caenispirillum salinarum TaxID=859058 RepID=UPI00384E2871